MYVYGYGVKFSKLEVSRWRKAQPKHLKAVEGYFRNCASKLKPSWSVRKWRHHHRFISKTSNSLHLHLTNFTSSSSPSQFPFSFEFLKISKLEKSKIDNNVEVVSERGSTTAGGSSSTAFRFPSPRRTWQNARIILRRRFREARIEVSLQRLLSATEAFHH